MASQSTLETFRNSWNETAAWAQSKGIKYNDYYPIYQQDSQRLLQYGSNATMSVAERERAIQAAANPNQAFQSTPSTASNPSNVIGNSVTDLRNIFTGLGDVVIHPLNNGLTDSVKNTFDLIDGDHKLTGTPGDKLGQLLTGTVLSFLPGAADVGTILQAGSLDAGLEELADHPIGSLLDLSGALQPVRLAGLVGEDEAASLAAKAGLSGDAAKHAGVVKVTKGLILNMPTKKLAATAGGELKELTLGERLSNWSGGSMAQLNSDIGDISQGYEMENNHYSNVRASIFGDWSEIRSSLDDAQVGKLGDLIYKAERGGEDAALKEVDDPRVVEAFQAWNDIRTYETEDALNAEGGPRLITNPHTGQQNVYSLVGHKTVIAAQEESSKTADDLLHSPEMDHMVELRAASDQAKAFWDQSLQGVKSGNQRAREVQVQGNVDPVVLSGARKIPFTKTPIATPFSKSRIATEGSDSLFGTGGWVDRLTEKADQGDFETVAHVADTTLKKLDHWSVKEGSVNAADDASWQALRTQIDQLGKSAKAMKKIKEEIDKEVSGTVKKFVADKPYRDQVHKDAEDSLKKVQQVQRSKLRDRQQQFQDTLHKGYNLKRHEIKDRYAQSLIQREGDARNITQKYELEKGKAKTQNLLQREAFEEWRRGRRAQGLAAPREYVQAAQEGVRIAPGAPGSPEALRASETALELEKQRELSLLPSEAELKAKFQSEVSAANRLETQMSKQLSDQQAKDEQALIDHHSQDLKALKKRNMGKQSRDGKWTKKVQAYIKAQKKFQQAVFDHPSDNYQPIWYDLFAKNLLEDERMRGSLGYKDKVLQEKYGWGQEHLDRLHSNPRTMSTLVQLGIHDSMDDPIFNDLDPALIRAAQQSAYEQIDQMAKEGLNPMWVHHVSSAPKSDAIHILASKGPKVDMLAPRAWGLDKSRFDIMASISHPMKQMLDQAATRDFVTKYLDPRVVTEDDVVDKMLEFYKDEVSGLDRQGTLDFAEEKMRDFGLREFDPASYGGFRAPRWGQGKVYMNAGVADAVEKLVSREGFLKGTIVEKATKLFRYSILGLSPRYTAHILFGGTFLLALHEPLFFLKIPQMLENFKNGLDPEDLQTGATNLGTIASDYQIDSMPKAQKAFGHVAGKNTARYLAQEHLEVVQGIKHTLAKPVDWLKALADINLHFTTTITHMQRSLAYLSGHDRALTRGMTEERAVYEGMQNAAKVMGDLRRMSPFERHVARTVMPFYGWQKHILSYVLTYPADHPWRTVMLSQMAEYDTSHTPGGLPSRYQFLFFLGSPDAQGNVTAVDLRALNPLRDVANYATWQGLISGINPVITAGFAAVDPSIIYGGNELYPNLTYDQFYGIEEAGPQGNLLTAASQIVPQVSAIQGAFQLAGQRQGMSDSDLIKSISNQLNFPWVPQQINIKQEAASTAIAQYHVASQLAQNAWETGNFQPISDLGSVPDPRNPDYETPVSDLEQMYNQLAVEYPGQSPSDTATPLPSVHL